MSRNKVVESSHYIKLIINFLTNTSNMFIKVKILINCPAYQGDPANPYTADSKKVVLQKH